jgi:hypothetical protein
MRPCKPSRRRQWFFKRWFNAAMSDEPYKSRPPDSPGTHYEIFKSKIFYGEIGIICTALLGWLLVSGSGIHWSDPVGGFFVLLIAGGFLGGEYGVNRARHR